MQPENIYPSPQDSHPQSEPANLSHGLEHHAFSQPQVTQATPSNWSTPAPSAPVSASSLETSSPPGDTPNDEPQAVVKVLSMRGVEYGMMTFALWIAASTMAWTILNLVNGSKGFNSVVVPVSALIISLPAYALFFLRLKKAELNNPKLALDPSKRRWSQTTQFLTYLACLVNLIYFVYALLQKISGNKGPSIAKSFINLIVVLVIAGGILAYYWHDEHRKRA